MFRISDRAIEKVWDTCLDSVTFLGIGYLSGRIVNWFIKRSSASAYFTKTPQIDLTNAAICCALFVVVDRISYTIFNQAFEAEELEKPFYSACRITLSGAAATALLNAVNESLNMASLEPKPACALILTAIVIYGQIWSHLNLFHLRYES